MKKQGAFYGLPMSIRYMSGGIFLVLAIYALLEPGVSNLSQMVCLIVLIGVAICFALKALVELFTFVFSSSARSAGKGLGRLFAIARNASRD